MTVQFTVETVEDLPYRRGLLLTGRLAGGPLAWGTILLEETSQTSVRVVSMDFPSKTQLAQGLRTLVVERSTAPLMGAGTVLISPA
jgi:hypothetical protein